jgi:hypothetical protein
MDMSTGLQHVKDRALERHNLVLTTADVLYLACQCEAGQGLVVRRADERNPTILIIVMIRGAALPVIFDPARGHIVTVLPRAYSLTSGRKQGKPLKRSARLTRLKRRLRKRHEATA